MNETDSVRFTFSAARSNTFQKTIEIKASLLNDKTDTVYFLSSSCDGAQYSLRYDTTRFELTPLIVCNASFPRFEKIAPKGQYDFLAHFSLITGETQIRLGFDFYQVAKSTDMSIISLRDIHNRRANAQKVIWAPEEPIR